VDVRADFSGSGVFVPKVSKVGLSKGSGFRVRLSVAKTAHAQFSDETITVTLSDGQYRRLLEEMAGWETTEEEEGRRGEV
jgi:hypothetical protein